MSAREQLVSDNFNRANGGLGANWTTVTGLAAPQISSNIVQTNAVASDSAAYYSATSFSNNQYAQVTCVAAVTSNVRAVGVILRAQAGANSYYRVMALGPLGASATLQIRKYVAGTSTSLASITTTINANDILRAEINGTLISAFINGDLRTSANDGGTFLSGNPGIIVFVDAGTAADAQLDSFSAGNLTGPITPNKLRPAIFKPGLAR